MDAANILQNRIASLERRVRNISIVAVTLMCFVAIGAARQQNPVLRARGLVIVDEAGRERILIGAPMSVASQNERLAGAVGLAVLDAIGRLSVALGTNNPLVLASGVLQRRMGIASGVNIYDPRTGAERGGMGVFEDGRANMCLDYGAAPKEAACMSVGVGDKYATFLLNGGPTEKDFDRAAMWVGSDGVGVLKAFGGFGNKGGVNIVTGRGAPSIRIYDTTGKVVSDLVGR